MKNIIISLLVITAIVIAPVYKANAQVSINTDGSNSVPSAMLEVKSTTKGFLPPRMTAAQRDAISNPAAGLIIYCTDCVEMQMFNGSSWVNMTSGITGHEPFYLGQDTLGGIVYYIYKDSNGAQHGLIVNKNESIAAWQTVTSTTNANRTEDGIYNTALMTNSPAATYANSLSDGGFTDWYVPSIDELSILWHNRFLTNKALRTGGFTLLAASEYWSSTEFNATYSYSFNFGFGYASNNSHPKYFSLRVRAVRAF